ncbi:MAG: M20 family metallopeptidase [Chloroflexi bacterium]|nr:M20 family metallopeptidase [Chloroflexota bacterium]MCI0830425.1 M20 family metallopeptidase [Chloroflexota bacterium]MCI0849006.1 M20 family metallopeptidase [Chloroflexota bacterium]MCI0900860.1 M20 family metallopeptidase [Chloroflexota bacterium]MCI0904298.1 M20 family metallopeptidase [Chloroflexota bacterium]
MTSSNVPVPDKKSLSETAAQAIEGARPELVELALDIHAHPELNYQEQHAAQLLSETLEKHGFKVERGVGGVETAFTATLSGGAGDGPTVAVLAEYDALPDIGHGCGHNLIAMAAIAAGLGLKANLDKLPGRVMVIGTPAEEGGGGKIRMLDAGVFEGVDAVLSSHPSSNRTVIPTDIPMGESWSLAMVGYRYIFHGKAAHAAAAPHEGINALNGVIHLFTGIDALRQHVREDVRIHGIITDGGKAPNVVPEYAAANFMLRCRDRDYLSDVVVGRVLQAAEGAAAMTGCRLEVEEYYPFYENVRPNAVIAGLLLNNAAVCGLKLDEPLPGRQGSAASTDFGNVSQAVPAYELRYAVSEQPVASHSREMAETAVSEYALNAAINVAKAMTLTACDLLLDPNLLPAARTEFEQRGGA